MSNELKHCPFCGSVVELVETDWSTFTDSGLITYEVVCPNWNCICATGIGDAQFETKEAAIDAWNKRDTWANGLPDKQKVIDFLKDLLESCRVRSNNADEEYSLVEELLKNLN